MFRTSIRNSGLPLIDKTINFLTNHYRFLFVLLLIQAMLIVINYYVKPGIFASQLISLTGTFNLPISLVRLCYWSLGTSIFLMALPIVFLKIAKKNLADYGLNFNCFIKHFPLYLLAFILFFPVLFIVSFEPSFIRTYPFIKAPQNIYIMLIWSAFYGLQFLALEFFFRGLMLHSLKKYVGNLAAVSIMVIPYMMIHFGKPWLETTAAIFAGFILGGLSLETGSIAGGVLLHVLVAWSMDYLALWQIGWFS